MAQLPAVAYPQVHQPVAIHRRLVGVVGHQIAHILGLQRGKTLVEALPGELTHPGLLRQPRYAVAIETLRRRGKLIELVACQGERAVQAPLVGQLPAQRQLDTITLGITGVLVERTAAFVVGYQLIAHADGEERHIVIQRQRLDVTTQPHFTVPGFLRLYAGVEATASGVGKLRERRRLEGRAGIDIRLVLRAIAVAQPGRAAPFVKGALATLVAVGGKIIVDIEIYPVKPRAQRQRQQLRQR